MDGGLTVLNPPPYIGFFFGENKYFSRFFVHLSAQLFGSNIVHPTSIRY